jgi:flagellar protein FlgJ
LGKKGREHRDPNRSDNPLLDTSGKYRNLKLSKNFTVGEFARSGNKAFTPARIDPKFVACLQRIRDDVDRPVRINSGYRSDSYNTALYRARGEKPTRSQHISGRAADIKIGRMTGKEIAEAAIDACGPQIAVGLGPQYAHIDMRGHFKIWKYKGVGPRQVAAVERHRQATMVAQKKRARRALASRT